MTCVMELRALAASKRRKAAIARKTGPWLSVVTERLSMFRHAEGLEAEATVLEARAAAVEAE